MTLVSNETSRSLAGQQICREPRATAPTCTLPNPKPQRAATRRSPHIDVGSCLRSGGDSTDTQPLQRSEIRGRLRCAHMAIVQICQVVLLRRRFSRCCFLYLERFLGSGCLWMLHKARYRFGRWTCNHDSFSNTTKTRISELGAGREGPYTLLLFTGSSCLCVTQRYFAGTVICHCCHARTHVTAGR